MKRIYVTSLNRVSDPNEDGDLGKLYVLDWDTKKIIPHSLESDTINIGRSRGVRGIEYVDNYLIVAVVTNKLSAYNADTMLLIKEWEVAETKFLHQIRLDNEGFLALASTGNDRIIRASNRKTYFIEELSWNKDIIDPYITHPNACPWGGDRLHFNSLAWDENGDEYHIYNAPRIIFNYTKQEVFAQGGPLLAMHDIVFMDNHLIVNASGDRTTLAIDRVTKEIRVIHKSRRYPNSEHNLHGMTRGLAAWKDYLFIGSTPGDLTLYQKKGNEYFFISNFQLTQDPKESIFDILLDPRDWIE